MALETHVFDEREHARALGGLFRATAAAMTRAGDDPAARQRVRESGAWLDAMLRAYGFDANAQWFGAVAARGADDPARAPYAWGALAAPRLEALADALESEGSLEPLQSAEAGAAAHALAIETCEEPVDPTQWLFCERHGERWAVEWDAVLEYGLAPGGEKTLIEITEGTEHATFVADWLHGKGTGRRRSEDGVEDADGHAHRILRLKDALALALQETTDSADILPEEPAPPAEPAPSQLAGPPVARALVADDSIVARVFLGRLLRRRGIEVDEAEDAATASELWTEHAYDHVFLDADMPGGGAFTIADAMRPEVVILVKDELERRHAHALGFEVVLIKPFAEDEVARAVDARVTRAGPGG